MEEQRSQDIALSDAVRRYGRKQPAVYRIAVGGVVAPEWSDRLGGLCIESRTGDDPNEPVTVLEGLIRDQAELSGILNTLYGRGYALLRVEMLNNESPQQGEGKPNS